METMKRMRLVEVERVVIEDVERPIPKADEALIKVMEVGVCGTDIHAYYGKHPYIKPPIVLGHEFSGVVAAVGKEISQSLVGSKVTVIPHLGCGHCDACLARMYNYCEELRCVGCQSTGAYAEYIVVPAKIVVPMPKTMSFEDGALVEPASVAYHGVRRGMKAGDNVLIMGAGPIGIMAMQCAKILGARRVAIADVKQNRLDLAKALGADAAIRPGTPSLELQLGEVFGSPKNIDFFGDYVGTSGAALDEIIGVARRGARVTLVGILGNNCQVHRLPDVVEHELTLVGSSMYIPQDFDDVIELLGKRELKTAGLITHHYSLQEIPRMYEMVAGGKENFVKIMISAQPNQG